MSGWPSDDLRNECDIALSWINWSNAISTSWLVKESLKSCWKLKAHLKINEFVQNTDVATVGKMKKVAQDFIKEAMQSGEDLRELAQLSIILNKRFRDCPLSFRDAVTLHLHKIYCELARNNCHSQFESLIKLIGQFFNIGWIGKDFLDAMFDGLLVDAFENDYKFNLFRQLLQVVSLKMIENGDSKRHKDYEKILKMRENEQ